VFRSRDKIIKIKRMTKEFEPNLSRGNGGFPFLPTPSESGTMKGFILLRIELQPEDPSFVSQTHPLGYVPILTHCHLPATPWVYGRAHLQQSVLRDPYRS